MIRKSLGLVLLLLAGPALAQGVSYNFIELGYERSEFDDIDLDGDGFGLGGSVEIGEYVFLLVDYSQISFDEGIDYDQLAVGAGYHVGMSARTDLYVGLLYVAAEASVGNDSADENGFGATMGIRGLLTDKFELQGDVTYIDLGDGIDGTSVGVMGRYSFTPVFAGTLNIGFDEDATNYGVGVRFYFGK
jgi:hypothetical protein